MTKRIIPCLDVKEGRVVKGVQFLGLKDAGDPVELAQMYDEEGADELVFLDILPLMKAGKRWWMWSSKWRPLLPSLYGRRRD